MQMQLYMSAVCDGRIPAGVFYFPASVSYSDSEEGKFRMLGFFNGDEEALVRGDKALATNGTSEFFGGKLSGKISENSMDGKTFADFIEYAKLIAKNAREEVESGYIEPTPYGATCKYCKFGGACGFCKGDKSTPREERSIKAKEIAEIVKKAKEEEDEDA
jgi:ATP-dependent helicase/DNAse subunit B